MNISIPVTIYWERILPNLWMNIGGSAGAYPSLTQGQRDLVRTRQPIKQALTTLFDKDYNDTLHKALGRFRQRVMDMLPHDRDHASQS